MWVVYGNSVYQELGLNFAPSLANKDFMSGEFHLSKKRPYFKARRLQLNYILLIQSLLEYLNVFDYAACSVQHMGLEITFNPKKICSLYFLHNKNPNCNKKLSYHIFFLWHIRGISAVWVLPGQIKTFYFIRKPEFRNLMKTALLWYMFPNVTFRSAIRQDA